MRMIKFFVQFMRNQEFNFEVLLKVRNIVFRFLEQKLLAFCEAKKSHTSAQYDKILSKVV